MARETVVSVEKELAVVPPKEKALQIFQTHKGLDPYLQIVRDKIDAFVPDVTTRKGREAIASIAYTVARSKTALDNRGKELVAELKEIPKLIDAERKRMRDTLDTWQEEVRRPLNEWQTAEDARIDAHKDSIDWLANRDDSLPDLSSAEIARRIDEAEAFVIGQHLEEFEADAARAKDAVLAKLRPAFLARQTHEAELAEIARFNAQKVIREQQERDAAIAKAAAEQAQRDAEAKAEAERNAGAIREQALKDQAAAQQRAAEQAARDADAAAENQRLQLKLQAEQAQRQAAQAEADRLAAIQQAEQERIAAERRQAEAVERARQEELERQAAAVAFELKQAKAREADLEHKKSINRAALEAFMASGMPEACAKQAVTLIAQRKIPAVAITY
jgi:colicin import membrane protein